MDLFESVNRDVLNRRSPLADRMRPRTLSEYVGQEKILGEGRILRRAVDLDQLSSLIFYGPPGVGKTTLARIIANTTKSHFLTINAVLAGIKDIRESIDEAQNTFKFYTRRTILFVDEVHRFNKAQQDALLPYVESGVVILIGATTENPYFEVNKALLSRSRIFELCLLSIENLQTVLLQALKDPVRGYGTKKILLSDEAIHHLCKSANGDARSVLNALELAVETTVPDENGLIHISRDIAEDSIQKRAVLYDKDGDAHYDIISAFIKSIRGSDPDAALFWLAKMIYAGEDPRFIFRRMIISASEDVGLADPNALAVVLSCAQAYDYIGMPEGRYPLSQACLYLATASKSNSTMALFDALKSIENEASLQDVPNHLKDASRDRHGLGHGEGYLYPHAYRDHWVNQQYLPEGLQGKIFYIPSDQGYEMTIAENVQSRRELQLVAYTFAQLNPFYVLPENNSWEERTWAGTEEYALNLRDLLFEMIHLTRCDLVLDMNCGVSGFFSMEALRLASEGGVWSYALNTKDAEAFDAYIGSLSYFQKPIISYGAILDLVSVIHSQSRSGDLPSFDAIVAHNLFASIEPRDYILFAQNISQLLSDTGRFVFAQYLPTESTCLSDFFTGDDKELVARVEEKLFSSAVSATGRFSQELLLSSLEKCGFSVSIMRKVFHVKKKISLALISHWFREADDSFASILLSLAGEKKVSTIREHLEKKLLHHETEWEQMNLLLIGRWDLHEGSEEA